MKKLIVMISAILFISQIYSCKSDSTNSTNDNLFIIEGKINSSVEISGAVLKMDVVYRPNDNTLMEYVFDSTIIASDGGFRLKISSPPSYFPEKKSFGNSIFSDTTSKFYIQGHFNVYKNGNYLGGVSCSEKASDSLGNSSSNYWITFIYSTKNVSIIGKDSIYSPFSITTYKYNMILNSGWNQLVYSISQPDSAIFNITVSADNNFKGNWFFQKY